MGDIPGNQYRSLGPRQQDRHYETGHQISASMYETITDESNCGCAFSKIPRERPRFRWTISMQDSLVREERTGLGCITATG